MRCATLAAVFLVTAGNMFLDAFAQTGGGNSEVVRPRVNASGGAVVPDFVVASIHQNRANPLMHGLHFTADGLSVQAFPLREIVSIALLPEHGSTEDELKGLPGWAGSEMFDIEAKVSNEDVSRWSRLPVVEQRIALRALLVERFQLRWHTESRPMQVYVLSVARGGPKMVQADSRPHMFSPAQRGYLDSHSTFMWQLVQELESRLDFPVVDRTGLSGTYNYKLEWAPDDQASNDERLPSLPLALKEQLGLKMEIQKAPIDVVVVDHIGQPSPN